jgi:alcohol dehydrogenase
MIRSGVLDLAHQRVTVFPLACANEAVRFAAAHGVPFHRTVLCPRTDLGERASA